MRSCAAFSLAQMYASKFGRPVFDPPARANFDNLANALLTVFIVVSGENWNDVLYNAMKVCSQFGRRAALSSSSSWSALPPPTRSDRLP